MNNVQITEKGFIMINRTVILEKLQSAISPKRFRHTLGVEKTAVDLAAHYHYDFIEKMQSAALLHDCAKDVPVPLMLRLSKEYKIPVDNVMKSQPHLIHSYLGAEIAKREYDVVDEEILNAIRYHTTGRPNMSLLEKIIFVADYIEPNRKEIPELDLLRKLAYNDLNSSIMKIFDHTIAYVKQRKLVVHPLTLEARESLSGEMISDNA